MGIDYQDPGERRVRGSHPAMNPALATPLYVLGAGFLVLFLYRLVTTIQHRRQLRSALQPNQRYTRQNAFTAWTKKHILYAPLSGTRHSRELRVFGLHMGTVPLRLETVLVGGYIGLNVAFFFALVDWWAEYQERLFQLKYAAGHLAAMNLPGLVLSVGRNNPLIQLLGIQFDGFNLLHRWVGRLVGVAAIVHVACVAAGHVALSGASHTTHLLFHAPFFVWGMVAFLAFLLLMLHSVSPLRHAFYEFFLHTHQFLAIVSFVGLWYHLRGLVQQYVLLATIIIWGLERTWRLANLLWHNCGRRFTSASVELLPAEDGVRVDVTLARDWRSRAGQYIYLYNPVIGLWTSHPFSVAWASTSTSTRPSSTLDPDTDRYDSSESLNSLDKERSPVTSLVKGREREKREEKATVSLLLKSQKGFTRHLTRKAMRSENRQFKTTVLAEGPFGGLHSLNSYGTVLLIAGGIGITHAMSYVREFVGSLNEGSIALRRLGLFWVTKRAGDLWWVDEWMRTVFEHPSVQSKEGPLALSIHVYITEDDHDEETAGTNLWVHHPPPGIEVVRGTQRPCFGHLVESEKKSQVGAMAVSVCGPGGMGDAVRKAVREAQGRERVDLYEEAFSW